MLAKTPQRLPRLSSFGSVSVHLRASRRTILAQVSAEADQNASQYQEFDVVEFVSPKGRPAVPDSPAIGCIVSISGEQVSIEELQREADPEASIWTQSGDEYVVPLSALRRTFEADYSQRMDADRIANPHGEHAHDVWEIPDLL